MTWTMLEKTPTTTPSLRCWATGLSEISSRSDIHPISSLAFHKYFIFVQSADETLFSPPLSSSIASTTNSNALILLYVWIVQKTHWPSLQQLASWLSQFKRTSLLCGQFVHLVVGQPLATCCIPPVSCYYLISVQINLVQKEIVCSCCGTDSTKNLGIKTRELCDCQSKGFGY